MVIQLSAIMLTRPWVHVRHTIHADSPQAALRGAATSCLVRKRKTKVQRDRIPFLSLPPDSAGPPQSKPHMNA